MTKTQSSSMNWSRHAGQLDFDNHRLSQSMVSGRQAIGGPSVDESREGKYTANVQSAIEDIAQLFPVAINQIVMFEEGTVPGGFSMIERLTIDGFTNNEPVYVYGIPVKTNPNENKQATTQKIYDTLQVEMANNKFFKKVEKVAGTDDQLDIEFIDTRPHDNFNFNTSTLTITGVTQQQAVPGYGTWSPIGTVDVTNADTGAVTKINYFKRIA